MLILIMTAILGLGFFTSTTTAQKQGINWYKLCTNPIVDILITEPCSTLTTNGGYTLTQEGNRVLSCLGGGALALTQPELMALKSLAPCGSNYSTGSSYSHTNNFANNQQDDPIGNILNGLFS